MNKQAAAQIDGFKQEFQKNRSQIIEEFLTFLRFQSISSEPEFKKDVLACAKWLENNLKQMGFQVEEWTGKGHPVLFATHLKAGPNKPTLLIYNHYDVQPVDPINLWTTPPFEPNIRNNQVFARGAQDNKGQCLYVLQALKTLLKRDGKLPLNVKLVIEGEEEMGSENLSHLLPQKKKELQADYLAVVDMGITDIETPCVTLGVRGLIAFDLEIVDANTDLHSGTHGGIVYNPVHAMVELLSKLRDPSGKVAIPGFYDDVRELSKEEKSQLFLEFDEKKYEQTFGTKSIGGEKGFTPHERAWLRPTIEINGINGGYSGSGFKTVIASKATAKLSCRLVPNQEPKKIEELVVKFLKAHAPKGLQLKIHTHGGGGLPTRANLSSKVVTAFAEAYKEVFQKPCKYILGGGSIPITAELAKASGSEFVLLGMGLDTDQIHAPNEHFGLDRIEKGYLVMCRALELLGE